MMLSSLPVNRAKLTEESELTACFVLYFLGQPFIPSTATPCCRESQNLAAVTNPILARFYFVIALHSKQDSTASHEQTPHNELTLLSSQPKVLHLL